MLARLDADDYLARSRIHLGLAWLAATFWFPTRAQHRLDQVDARALTAVADIGLRFHNVSAWVAMTFGDVERFRREYEAWVAAARANGVARTFVAALVNGAMCFAFFGMHDEAQRNIDRAFRVTRESPAAMATSNAMPSPDCVTSCAAISKGPKRRSSKFRRRQRTTFILLSRRRLGRSSPPISTIAR
jgi:hypothetical protein